ncbi:MAG TPA: fused MFS/spermidine synthase, partial [Verrucomicrobiota bacterium]|nr:fused MFS/spermidine synthase [Verrucomicrobiota bacterium]
MNSSTASSAESESLNRKLPFLLLLFVGSGCAALIYEVVWFQLLGFVIGSSAVSLGVLLGTYMGGMCLGSLLLARMVSARHHPLRVYALLEIGIGVCGVLVLIVVPQVMKIYVAGVGYGLGSILLRGLVCAICLLPPTLLMGATLPAMSRWLETTPRGVSWLGFFYGGNIAGAVFGCLLAGFYLLRVHDMATATGVAAALNVTVAVAALLLAGRAHAREGVRSEPAARRGDKGAGLVYVVIAISGLCALGAEVIWTRLLSLLLGATVYTFSIILAVFLVGLGIGSSVGSIVARSVERPRVALGLCQLFAALGMSWSAYMLFKSVAFWPVNPSLSTDPWVNFQMDLARCFWAILPAPLFWGASFPLALAAVAKPGQDPGGIVGKVYAANTVGAILGALGASVILVGWLGTQKAQQWLIGLSGAGAVLMLLFLFIGWKGVPAPRLLARAVAMLAVAAMTWLLARSVPELPWRLVTYGRYMMTYEDQPAVLFLGEGLNASVAVTELEGGVRSFHVSGKVEASSLPEDMRLQRMLGHIPALLHPNPKSVLIVGCGAGVTAGTFTLYPSVERIVICEIEPLIPQRVAPFFARENYNVVNDPRVEIVYDDARHYVLTTKEKFDIITSDPIHPWVKGAATLYTQEYFEMVKQHLNPGGLVTQWVPLYESNLDVVKSEVATFFSVFTNATIWSNDAQGQGYDTVLLG